MKHQQAIYLQEMGITRWQVRKPELFGDSLVNQSLDLSGYSILIICSEKDFNNPLMGKILSAFKFPPATVYHCSMDEFENYQGNLPEYIWSTLGRIKQVFGHKLLISKTLSQLENNPKEKRVLWNQFCAFNQE